MTPADEIRAAASRLRELTEPTSSGPWYADHPEPRHWGDDARDSQILSGGKPIATLDVEHGGALNADYIAAMDPRVGLAVADLLGFEADLIDIAPHTTVGPRLDRILTIARLINQETT